MKSDPIVLHTWRLYRSALRATIRARKALFVAGILLLVGCETDHSGFESPGHVARRQWSEPCHDEAILLATTSGSPSHKQCPNRLHRMRVQIASAPSNEEFGAVVFCECRRGTDGGQ